MIAAILLAAGRGRRFGGAKLTAMLDDEPIIRHAARRLSEARLAPLIVVVSADDAAGRVRDALRDLPVSFVENPNVDAGMGTSIAAGVAALPDECDAVVIALGDQPRIDTRVVDAMVAASSGSRDRIVVPSYRGVRANPVVFGRAFFAELMALDGDTGARVVVEGHATSVRILALDADVPRDIDTVTDLETMRGAVSDPRQTFPE